jgi:hypothetical protein
MAAFGSIAIFGTFFKSSMIKKINFSLLLCHVQIKNERIRTFCVGFNEQLATGYFI